MPPLKAPRWALTALSRHAATRPIPFLAFYRLALTTEQAQALDLLDADGKAEADGHPGPRARPAG